MLRLDSFFLQLGKDLQLLDQPLIIHKLLFQSLSQVFYLVLYLFLFFLRVVGPSGDSGLKLEPGFDDRKHGSLNIFDHYYQLSIK